MEIICHHCIASRTITHRNRHCVMLLVCADDRQFLLQAVDDTDLQEWMHAINKVCVISVMFICLFIYCTCHAVSRAKTMTKIRIKSPRSLFFGPY